jgi:hypothetical protein
MKTLNQYIADMKATSKLLKALQEIKPVIKDKKNPHFKNTYADINTMLQEVKPILLKNGLILLQPIVGGNVCSQIYDAETGEMIIESTLEMTQGLNAQQKGSEITYFRRYTLQSLLGLEAEDDDGNTATTTTPATPEPEKWLNDVDKQGNETQEWANLKRAIATYQVHSVAEVRKYYKISKEIAAKLEALING